MSNRENPTVSVVWSRMLPAGDDPVYRRECPFCEDGIFLVGRNRETLELLEYDMCILCGQTICYIDIEEMRKRERPRE